MEANEEKGAGDELPNLPKSIIKMLEALFLLIVGKGGNARKAGEHSSVLGLDKRMTLVVEGKPSTGKSRLVSFIQKVWHVKSYSLVDGWTVQE